ncbi:SH3 domain-containing protein C23A1.17-like [Ceratina calcarata]|uniref:SH3 domain-containing protein C23A1.17-like n=1 Tax=Ceratina calcarata TaxID=156304 RepID=A0AAJ7IZU8_9HYME|nr:SH3 domain-containing protein C23A1.17-like [Ceratina calcarata]
MKFLLIMCFLVASLLCVKSETKEDDKPEITKLELVDLGEGESDDAEETEVHRKRDSGYSYKRPGPSGRVRFQVQSGTRGRIVNRHPAQINRPVTKYGPPGYQNPMRPASHGQQHRDKLQFHGHIGQQHSNNFDGRPGGLVQQEVPSPIREVDFAEPNPISTQNNEPFAIHSANYLPPENQKLPEHSTVQSFSPTPVSVNRGQASLHSQNLVQSQQGHISDAALFLAQNAQAIQQLYGAPANEQDFAPQTDQFLGHNNQVPNGQFQNLESSSQSPQSFSAPLPSYASGTLSAHETLEQIQSLEKDRLIVQLQRALASQTQNADVAGRYAQNQPSFVQSQDLLASLGQRMKIHGLNTQQSSVNLGNTAFNQSPFLLGTTVGPGFPLSYGLSTTTQTPTTTTTTTTTMQPPAKSDGTVQVGSAVPAPPLSTSGVPVYGGFVPTLIAGTNFVPTYGPTFFAPGAISPAGSSPTHFGLPIPTIPSQKPISGTPPLSTTPSTPPTNQPAVPQSPVPVQPVAPVRPVAPLHPVAPVQPVTPLHPVAPIQPASHPTYGLQTPVINPVIYKPIKPVYPFYYYPNVAYQVHKSATFPTHPWSYAPTYAQAKPTQIWK